MPLPFALAASSFFGGGGGGPAGELTKSPTSASGDIDASGDVAFGAVNIGTGGRSAGPLKLSGGMTALVVVAGLVSIALLLRRGGK